MMTERKANYLRTRKRLVINFDQRQSSESVGRRGLRWPKLLALFGIIIVVVAVAGAGGFYFWWQNYKTMPAYSLALLIDASQRNDVATIGQRIDTETIVTNLANQVTEKSAARYGSSLSLIARSRVETLVSGLLPGVKQVVRDEVVKRVREIAEISELEPFVLFAIGLPYFVNITAEGDSARVTSISSNRQIELTMQRAGERWKVTAIKDDLLSQRIVDELIKDLPAIGQQLGELGIHKQSQLLSNPKSKRQRSKARQDE